MNLALELVTLPEEADSLLNTALREKRILENRKETTDIRTDTSAENAQELQMELAGAQSELASANAYIATLPEGKAKEKQITKRIAIELRIRRLNESGTRLGAVAIVQQKFDAIQLQNQIDSIEAFITAVNTRKAELQI